MSAASPDTSALHDAHATVAAGEKNDFIRQIVREDLASGKHAVVHTRFPPEPNGYLHIGHAKAICLNFGIAGEYGGICNLRFDDTNPAKEDPEFVAAIQDDVRWLGFEWASLRHASDYFEVYYLAAEKLIGDGLAYVDDLDVQAMREYRGTLTAPGRESPFRNRPVEENLDLFRRMRAGEFPPRST
jgi:glutaminyl-tRNA synthetase